MSIHHSIIAEFREGQGKGASRRLRHQGKVPAIIYGGHLDPVALSLSQNELLHATEHESFYSSIIEIKVGTDLTQQAVVRDMQRHPYKPVIMHVDFMRVTADELLTISVPVHFMGEEQSPAGKASGVVIQHLMTEIEIEALPKDLPEFLSVDLSKIEAGDSVMLSTVVLPEGVTIPSLELGLEHDTAIAHAVHVKESQGSDADGEEPEVAEDEEDSKDREADKDD
ncbi:MAG: 50S ribosomal protein L25/general stress protein Ctc [Xanthomonadales bacterium]|nr:50S ribosomal protein L25/general stress protein Ctc [Xanthomonadales bacterium]